MKLERSRLGLWICLVVHCGSSESVFQDIPPLFGNRCIRDIWGSGFSDIYFAGDAGTILHWDGSDFEAVPRLTLSDLNCVWGDVEGMIYAAGKDGVLLKRESAFLDLVLP